MKIFITVGTTPFNQLIKKCDDIALDFKNTEFLAQIAEGSYNPFQLKYFDFSDTIENYFEWADLIICHSGAGTIYRLLELGKKIIVVPNTDRRENHQLELCRYVKENSFGLVVYDLDNLKEVILASNNFIPEPYCKSNGPDLAKTIIELILKEYNK